LKAQLAAGSPEDSTGEHDITKVTNEIKPTEETVRNTSQVKYSTTHLDTTEYNTRASQHSTQTQFVQVGVKMANGVGLRHN
jgi:hypothetical protein